MFWLGCDLPDHFAARRRSRADQYFGVRQAAVDDLLRAVLSGFLALPGFAYLVGSALTHAELVPALVMISV